MRRRKFLKAAGLTLTLPALESLGGAVDLADAPNIKRLFLMTDGYGFHTPFFYPTATGLNYPTNDVIKSLEPLRKHVSILGNLQHMSGHSSQKFVATGTPASPHFGDSIDQYVARHVSHRVPIDSLLMSMRTTAAGGAYRNKVPVAMFSDPEDTFNFLFTKGNVKERSKDLRRQQSVLDLSLEQANALSRQVSTSDKRRLDEYFNSIRETEKIVKKDTKFLHEPNIDPGITKEDLAKFHDGGAGEPYFAFLRTQMRFVELAFKFDLTRVAYLWEHGQNHGATHHGGRAKPGGTLWKHAKGTIEAIATTLTNFKNTKMAGGNTLLDETLFVWTAALGNAAGHTGNNAPAILAGGGLQHHGRYTHYKELEKNTKLYLAIIQKMGIETDNFNNSQHTLTL